MRRGSNIPKRKLKLSVVVPAHNEEANIERIISEVEKIRPDELVVVDDCSTDRTAEKIKKMKRKHANIKVVTREGGRGFHKALKAGFAAATGDVVVPVMGDLCDRLADIPKMVAKVGEGYDVVCGSRHVEGGAILNSEGIKTQFSKIVGSLNHYLGGIPTKDVTNAFKAYRKHVLHSIEPKAKSFDISMEITVKAYGKGYRITDIATVWTGRKKGKSKFKVFRQGPDYLKWTLLCIGYRFKPKKH